MKFQDCHGNEHELPEGRTFSRRPSAYALIEKDNKILLIKGKQHRLWELPGGGINPGELILEGLIREVFEETGYKVSAKASLPFHIGENLFYAQDVDEYWQVIPMVFKAELTDENQETKHIDFKNEISEIKWVKLQELQKKKVHSLTEKVIKLYLL